MSHNNSPSIKNFKYFKNPNITTNCWNIVVNIVEIRKYKLYFDYNYTILLTK